MKKILLLSLIIVQFAHAKWPDKSVLPIKQTNFSYYTSHDLEEFNEDIKKVILSVHGSERNVETYFKTMSAIAKKLGQENQTLIIAPHFKISGDTLINNEAVFSYEGWWIGDQSLNGSKISSFEFMDEIFEQLQNKTLFPNLEEVILVGHSAGGHFTQRYGLGTNLGDYSNIKFKFVVANPGTYAYLNEKRAVNYNSQNYARPVNPGCAYNNYKYGLENLNIYLRRTSINILIDQYLERDMTYLIGQADTGEVEMTCEARWQGRTRFERGILFKAHLDLDFPQHRHKLVIVPNIGHTQHGMYNSSQGINVIFNR